MKLSQKLSPKFSCAIKTIATASLPLVLGSMTMDTTDPSLLAAPVYEPEKWNDISNEDLAAFYQRHQKLVDSAVSMTFEGDREMIDLVYARPAHAGMDKANYVIHNMHNDLEDFKDMPDYEIAQFYMESFGISQFEALSALKDVQRIFEPTRIQQINNCYAYSANDADVSDNPDDYQADPGLRTRGPDIIKANPYLANTYKAFVRQTIDGVISDGMIFTGKTMQSREGYYRVALYIRPALEDTNIKYKTHEFHFARQNRDGTWSHKYGNMNAINTDYAGRIMTDAAKADMGNYRFMGYFLAPKGGLDVGLPDEKSTKPGSKKPYSPSEARTATPTLTPLSVSASTKGPTATP